MVGVRLASLVVGLIVARASVAAAENCVDKEVARAQGGRPCMDLGTSFGRAEVWRAPGFVDVRVNVFRMGLYGNDADRHATGFELATWEAIGDDDNLEAPRDYGDRSALHVLTLRRELDTDGWGAYVAGDLVTHWFGHTRIVTPRLGLRLGRFDRAALVIEARLAGAYLIGGDDDRRALGEDVDVGARATLVVSRRIRLETRGRYRDLTAADGRRLRDVVGAVGVELEASPPGPPSLKPTENTWRVMTLFAGIGLRRALHDERPGDELPTARGVPAAAAPWQVMAWVDLDFCINSSRAIW